MSPLMPRRRARRRSVSGRIVLGLCVLVLLGLLIGGLTQVNRESGPYDSSINRSFAVAGSVLVDESNASAIQVGRILTTMQDDSRPELQAGLDAAVLETSQQAGRAADLASSSPTGHFSAALAAVFADRAHALVEVRAAIDGLLGMTPLAVAGAPGSTTAATIPSMLSATAVTDRISGAGQLLIHSDQQYRQVRRTLAAAAGHARMPASVWVTNPAEWQIDSVAVQVNLVAASAALAVVHHVILRAIRLEPAALPSPTGAPSSASMLSPTSEVQVIVVISNLGSVDEPHTDVQFTLALQPSGPTQSGLTRTVRRSVALPSGTSATLNPAQFSVTPGSSYFLTISIVSPAGQTSSLHELLQIAPST
jgi:hypothetical protein